MIITDGKKMAEITIQRWNGNGYDPDWSQDYFDAGSLRQTEDGAYIVDDVDYCVDFAADADNSESAVYGDPDVCVFAEIGKY